MTDYELLCKEFYTLNNLHYHEYIIRPCSLGTVRFRCKTCGSIQDNPSLLHANEIFEIMMTRHDWMEFLQMLYESLDVGHHVLDKFIEHYIDDPRNLLEQSILWCKKHDKK